MIIIGNSPKDFPFRSKTIYERLKLIRACWLYVLATRWLTTCGSPLNPAPTGFLRLPAGKHISILTEFQIKVNKKSTCNYYKKLRKKFNIEVKSRGEHLLEEN
jgi:hypothetical protein